MRWIAHLSLAVLALTLVAPAAAQDPAPGEATSIAWAANLPAALAAAKSSDKVLMICINAKSVDGEAEEPAAKGLREIVYNNPRVVDQSRHLVCVLLTKDGSSKEYDVLRALGIDGDIISPQHVFLAPEGDRIVHRQEYWRFGAGEKAADALLSMMTKARVAASLDAPEAAPEGGAGDGALGARAAWITERLDKLATPGRERDQALAELVAADKDGDCTGALIGAIETYDKNESTLRAIVRAFGQDGLEAAALPLAELLKHKMDSIKLNAAVSLEYIGSKDKKVIAALRRVAEKSKDPALANHAYRALGRCGAGDSKIRSLLLKQASSGKSEFASYGPCIALTYFEGDTKAMRGVEKLLKSIGVPGGRRGGGTNTVKRGLVSWVLASIGDEKSADFVREELVDGLKNVKAFWVDGLRRFWENTADACDGEEGALGKVEAGVGGFVAFSRRGDLSRYGAEDGHLMDEARTDRSPTGEFRPKGDGILDVGGGDE